MILSKILSEILTEILSEILSEIVSEILSDILYELLSEIISEILSEIPWDITFDIPSDDPSDIQSNIWCLTVVEIFPSASSPYFRLVLFTYLMKYIDNENWDWIICNDIYFTSPCFQLLISLFSSSYFIARIPEKLTTTGTISGWPHPSSQPIISFGRH